MCALRQVSNAVGDSPSLAKNNHRGITIGMADSELLIDADKAEWEITYGPGGAVTQRILILTKETKTVAQFNGDAVQGWWFTKET